MDNIGQIKVVPRLVSDDHTYIRQPNTAIYLADIQQVGKKEG